METFVWLRRLRVEEDEKFLCALLSVKLEVFFGMCGRSLGGMAGCESHGSLVT